MTMRTIQVLGHGYGASDATIIATLNGNTVFSGSVPTIDEPPPENPDAATVNSTVPLFSFEIPIDFVGTIPMTCQTTAEMVVFAQIRANYSNYRPSATQGMDPKALPASVSSGADIYVDLGSFLDSDTDPRTNVTIDGTSMTHENPAGTWWWHIPATSTLAYDLEISQAGNIS